MSLETESTGMNYLMCAAFRPPIRWIQSLPSLSLCRCLCQRNETVKALTHKLTGATGILIFYSILPEKTLTVQPNKVAGCRAFTKLSFGSLFIFKDPRANAWLIHLELSMFNCLSGVRSKFEKMTVQGGNLVMGH